MKLQQLPPTPDRARLHIAEAFNHFCEARRTMTALEVEQYIAANLPELGHRGFVENIGKIISDATSTGV